MGWAAWWPVSKMASRRCPRATVSQFHTPSSSGPRWRCASIMLRISPMQSGGRGPHIPIIPAIPHMLSSLGLPWPEPAHGALRSGHLFRRKKQSVPVRQRNPPCRWGRNTKHPRSMKTSRWRKFTDLVRLYRAAPGSAHIFLRREYDRYYRLLRRLAKAHRLLALRRTRVVAVVGSLGKTTTRRALHAAPGLSRPRLLLQQLRCEPGGQRAARPAGRCPRRHRSRRRRAGAHGAVRRNDPAGHRRGDIHQE